MMASKPIIFSGPMVRAIIEGRKTQTRRVARVFEPEVGSGSKPVPKGIFTPGPGAPFLHPAPYAVGDRLWVRETWVRGLAELGQRPVYYRADGEDDCTVWRPSIHMPRWASRITLTVTEIRCQRLQEISDLDIAAEGVRADLPCGRSHYTEHPTMAPMTWSAGRDFTPTAAFKRLWDSINGKRPGCAWAENPWVFAYSFTVAAGNIDEIARAA